MKVDSNEVWDDYVKSGEVKGFSIDAFVTLEEVKLNKDKQMEKQKTVSEIAIELKDAIIDSLKPKVKEVKKEDAKVEFGSVNSVDGMIFMYEGETPEVGGAVWIVAEDGETRVPVPVGDHALEGGGVLVVTEEGIIGEAKAEEPAELDEAGAAPAQPAAAAEAVDQIKSILVKFTEEANASRLEFEKMIDEKLKGYEGKLVEFSEQPADKPTRSRVEPVVLNKAGRLLNKLRQA